MHRRRQPYGAFVISSERKLFKFKLHCTLNLLSLDAERDIKVRAPCGGVPHFLTMLCAKVNDLRLLNP